MSPFWKTKKENTLKEVFSIHVTAEEKAFLEEKAKKDCTSRNAIIRKAINLLKKEP